MIWSRYVIGFHGCDAELAREVVCNNANLKISQNDYDWLGNGIYFWEGSCKRALQWAEKAKSHGNKKINKPAALGAIIDVSSCLNLVEAEHLEIVRESYKQMEEALAVSNSPLPKNTGKGKSARKLDCAVFEFMHQVRKHEGRAQFDTIRAFFIEGDELYPGAGIRNSDHIQLCVRNPEQIVGYFLPK